MTANRVVLILGAGPRIGTAVAERFANDGYKVAIVSRSSRGVKDASTYFSLKGDLSTPEAIPALFSTVKAEFKSSPSVVVYNAGTLTNPPDQDSVLSAPADSVYSDFKANTISPYVAAQEAVKGWKSLPEDFTKTFIYTGNITNVSIVPMPMMLTIGMGKAASAFWVGLADAMYSKQGFRQVLDPISSMVPNSFSRVDSSMQTNAMKMAR